MHGVEPINLFSTLEIPRNDNMGNTLTQTGLKEHLRYLYQAIFDLTPQPGTIQRTYPTLV